MSTPNKMLLQRFFQAIYNQGDLDVADEIVAANYINHNPVPGEAPGREGLKAFVAHLRRAFGDLHIAIEDQVADEDKVVTRFTISGAHADEFAGIPTTGKRATVTAIGIHRIANGQIQESWLNWDALGLMQQLGAGPSVPISSKA
ncbi:MAG: ester cyclase [Caldilineaceae bacterium]